MAPWFSLHFFLSSFEAKEKIVNLNYNRKKQIVNDVFKLNFSEFVIARCCNNQMKLCQHLLICDLNTLPKSGMEISNETTKSLVFKNFCSPLNWEFQFDGYLHYICIQFSSPFALKITKTKNNSKKHEETKNCMLLLTQILAFVFIIYLTEYTHSFKRCSIGFNSRIDSLVVRST